MQSGLSYIEIDKGWNLPLPICVFIKKKWQIFKYKKKKVNIDRNLDADFF